MKSKYETDFIWFPNFTLSLCLCTFHTLGIYRQMGGTVGRLGTFCKRLKVEGAVQKMSWAQMLAVTSRGSSSLHKRNSFLCLFQNLERFKNLT